MGGISHFLVGGHIFFHEFFFPCGAIVGDFINDGGGTTKLVGGLSFTGGGGFSKFSVGGGGGPPHPPTMENPGSTRG